VETISNKKKVGDTKLCLQCTKDLKKNGENFNVPM